MNVVFDAGAFIAFERGDRTVAASLRVAQQERHPVRTSSAVVAQVWRSPRQVGLARALAGLDTVAFDLTAAFAVGELLARCRTGDVVDGHVATLVAEGDVLLTSDERDLDRLLQARGVRAKIRPV